MKAGPEEESLQDNVRIARSELLAILLTWTAFMIWVLAHAQLRGYRRGGGEELVPLVLGMPAWVFWGILVPWLVATLYTVWFCVRALRKP